MTTPPRKGVRRTASWITRQTRGFCHWEAGITDRRYLGREYRGNDPALQYEGIEPNSSLERLEALRGLILYGRLGTKQEDPLPEFPLELNHPNIYYLYVGNAR